MVGAKGVPQSVEAVRNFQGLPQFQISVLERMDARRINFAGSQCAEWFKPCGKGRAGCHKATLAGLGIAGGNFNVSLDAPHVRPIQPHDFFAAQSGKPGNGDHRAQIRAGIAQKRLHFSRAEKIGFRRVRNFNRQTIGFQQAMIDGQIILPGAPLQEHLHRGAAVVSRFGREFFERLGVGGQVFLAQIANRRSGERVGKFAQP